MSTVTPLSTITTPRANGIMAGTVMAMTTMMTGASEWMKCVEPRGVISSLKTSLNTSANGCRNPTGPTLLGPGLFCMKPDTRRSA